MRHVVRTLWVLGGLLVAVGVLDWVAGAWSQRHIRAVHGATDGPTGCTECHGSSGPPPPTGDAMHADPRHLASSPDGRLLVATCAPRRGVAFVDVSMRRMARFVEVPGRPAGVAVSPDGRDVAVSLEDVDRVLVLEAATGRVRAQLATGASPAGLCYDAPGARLFVAERFAGVVAVIDIASGAVLRRIPAGRDPFTIVRSPDGHTVAAVSRRAELDRPEALPRSLVTLLDGHTGRLIGRVTLPSCHMAEAAAFTPDGGTLLVPAICVRNRLPILQVARGWVLSSVLAVIDVGQLRAVVLPLNECNEGFPDPTGVAIEPDGARAWVASGGRDEVAMLDMERLQERARSVNADEAEHFGWTREYLVRRVPVGANPRAVLALQHAGRARVAVAEPLDDSIALLDADGDLLARVAIGARIEDDAVRRGARIFHSAQFAFQQSFSCRSCHPDGHTDGLVYDFDIDGVGRNAVLNRSLRGIAGTGPFKWIGLNPTLAQQCGPRFAKVLTRADPMQDEQLADLTAYLHSLPAPRPDRQTGRIEDRDTGAVERGRRLFERVARKDGTPIHSAGRCVTCHPPPLYTNRRRADVGTRGPSDSTGLFDVPHLTGIARKAPYLHDGRACSLEEIWTLPDVGDRHGAVTDLDKKDLNDLVAFLKGL